jgi:hypothetical protein
MMFQSKRESYSPTRRRRSSPLDVDDNHDNASGASLHWKKQQQGQDELPNTKIHHNMSLGRSDDEEKKGRFLQRILLPCHVRQRITSLRFYLDKIPPHRINALCLLSILLSGWSQWASWQTVITNDSAKGVAWLRSAPTKTDNFSIRFSSATTFATFLEPQEPDFGGLELKFQKSATQTNFNLLERARSIAPDDAQRHARQHSQLLQAIDDPNMSDRLSFDEELDYPVTCERTSWGRKIHPVCNSIHELSALLGRPPPPPTPSRAVNDLPNDHFQTDYLSNGYFRDSWLYRHPKGSSLALDNTHDHSSSSSSSPSSSSFVLKTLRAFQNYDYDTTYLIENEAVIMERLTASPRIVDIYGLCGTSLAAEYMQDMTLELVPGKFIFAGDRGRMKQTDLDELQERTGGDVQPLNNQTIGEKLELALIMAESMADLHGFAGGAIVHGDVHPDQWLRTLSGQMKLNDFNNGMILEYNAQNRSYCDFWSLYDGAYKAPEECGGGYVGAPSDVFAMGNNIYILLTGLYPFYDTTSISKIEQMVQAGETPFVDDRYRNRSMVEGRLVEIMEPCWAFDPVDRVDIFEIVAHLRETQRLYQQETVQTM